MIRRLDRADRRHVRAARKPLVGPGDRVVFLGELGPRGKHADTLSVRRSFSVIRLDSGTALLALTRDLHPIPRRPRPDF